MKKVTAIVPCLNEKSTVAGVVNALQECKVIHSIILVDDGSQQETKAVILSLPKKKLIILSLQQNVGKGGAVKLGLRFVNTPFVFLCDADLEGLRPSHIEEIVIPVLEGRAEVCVGLKDTYGSIGKNLRKSLLPLIAGERAMPAKLLREVLENELSQKYGLEPVINFHCKSNKLRVVKIILKGVRDKPKYRKWDNGFSYFVDETRNIATVYAKLYVQPDYQLQRIAGMKILPRKAKTALEKQYNTYSLAYKYGLKPSIKRFLRKIDLP